MAGIYIVNVASSSEGWPTSSGRYYYHTEGEVLLVRDGLGEDPTLIELIRLDATTLRAWEGTIGTYDDPDGGGGWERPTG